ncbi:zinc-binding dehydrogenase [Rhodococcus sp. ABRD24]|uniref:zinc-binding dehydrogenase n=1 Tax=Rhodococcus sp. ABRD24 TaxID=2507582 RepID=UPI00103D13FC|nr:zinc-binding dehydrogenase [Rhodococcus sp. ABRD24]QBJ96562.1 zinc-binding dehydrogenase [Rhodococcus sp. ABRD24]
MSRTMRAQRLHTATGTVTVEDIPIPQPGPGEVLVEIAFCGICHSDLSLIDGTFPPPLPMVTQGHEASGVVTELGAGVTTWAKGDRVLLRAGRACSRCRNCICGRNEECQDRQSMAFHYDGAWAEYALAQESGLVRVPDNVPLEQAALLTDAVATPYGAVVSTGKVAIGETVGVWGVGGIGSHTVQIARLVGAVPIIAFDVNPAVLERALDLGADYAFDSRDENLKQKVAEVTDGRMLDVAFDSVGLGSTFDQALEFLRIGGRLVVVGLSDQKATLGDITSFGLSRKQVLAHFGGSPAALETLTELVSRGRLDLNRSISEIISLEDIASGIAKLRNHEGNPIRILVDPRRG